MGEKFFSKFNIFCLIRASLFKKSLLFFFVIVVLGELKNEVLIDFFEVWFVLPINKSGIVLGTIVTFIT